MNATHIPAVEPSQLTPQTRQKYCNPNALNMLSPQQVCCTFSHIRAWEGFLRTGEPHALILEDDAVLSDSLPDFLENVAPIEFDLISIEAPYRRLLVEKKPGPERVAGIQLRKFRSTSWGSAGYVISAGAARKLVNSPRLFNLPMDAALFCPLEKPGCELKLFQADPALCVQLKNADQQHNSEASQSNIYEFITPATWRGRTSRWKRHLRWGVIKGWEMLCKPRYARRTIPFEKESLSDSRNNAQS